MRLDAINDNPDDPSHPIPTVNGCDVFGIRKDGGGDIAFVIASPIRDDANSRRRLIRKLENYLAFIASSSFSEKCGEPSPQNTKIVFYVHPLSDSGILELIRESRPWINDNHAELELNILQPEIP